MSTIRRRLLYRRTIPAKNRLIPTRDESRARQCGRPAKQERTKVTFLSCSAHRKTRATIGQVEKSSFCGSNYTVSTMKGFTVAVIRPFPVENNNRQCSKSLTKIQY